MNNNSCCFIGHRKIENEERVKIKLISVIEDLILNYNVTKFLLGSNSDFNNLCHSVVTDLKQKYPYIERYSYTCKSEKSFLESEVTKWQNILSKLYKSEVNVLGVEKEIEHKNKYVASKSSYIERNQAMIDDSNYCIFYYNENYKPKTKKYKKSDYFEYQPKSGTAIAYKYAIQKNKNIINIYENNI